MFAFQVTALAKFEIFAPLGAVRGATSRTLNAVFAAVVRVVLRQQFNSIPVLWVYTSRVHLMVATAADKQVLPLSRRIAVLTL